MSEVLTADERALVPSGGAYMSTKLLRLYDAALARAEAAEKWSRDMNEDAGRYFARVEAAESRLAEATALLVHWYEARYMSSKGGSRAERVRKTRAFLSATPAQAAEPVTETWDDYANCALDCMQSDGKPHPRCPRHGVKEHPDTIAQAAEPSPNSDAEFEADCLEAAMRNGRTLAIALRECRASLRRQDMAILSMDAALGSARAERDTWNHTAERLQGELTTALARIARAVAELEKPNNDSSPWPLVEKIDAALEALR